MTSRLKKVNCTRIYLSQGSYRSWKTWKVVEFYFDIFQDWKVLEKDFRSSGKSWKSAYLKWLSFHNLCYKKSIWIMRRFDFEILGNLEAKKNQSESWKSPWNLFLKKGTNPVVTLHHHDFLNPSRYCTMAERQDNSQPDLGKHKVLLHIKCELFK